MRRPHKNQNGIAMMVVLWVLVLLMALATEFAFSMKMEVNTTRNFKEDIESYYLAKAGISLAMSEVLSPARFHSIHSEHGWIYGEPLASEINSDPRNPQTNGAQIKEFEIQKFQIDDQSTPKEGEETEDIKEYEIVARQNVPFGNGAISYSITDENSKISINTASRGVLIKALEFSGVEVGEERDIIADSILDWIDKDSNHRINGAESDYYQNQDPPYNSKNGTIESLEELLKVRGMTKEIFFGSSGDETKKHTGLDKIFTVYDATPVNPNTASPEVLSILFEQNEINEILRLKSENGYYNETTSTHFRIQSTGSLGEGKTRHTISVVMEKPKGAVNTGLLTHYWNDNHIDR
jgi:general secretion pathway protein K